MIFSLEVLKAYQGDCLLLHFGTDNEPGLILIDGGPDKVYPKYLKKRLLAIKQERELTETEPLVVDLLMVSHIDEDHIQGILDLTDEEIEAMNAQQPRMLNVLSFWHNSFKDIIAHEPGDLSASMTKHFGEAAVSGGGELPEMAKDEVEEECPEDPEVVTSSLKVLASIKQGVRLLINADKFSEFSEYQHNMEFGGNPIMARQNAKAKTIAQDLKFTVVGPMEPELEALRQKHIKWLEDLKKEGKSIPQALAAYIDTSLPNLSSIVVLAEVGGKRMLLTGDARGDKILEGLQLTGLLGPGQESTIQIDVLKVPHHGSARNLEQDFFQRIIANHYVFSGNGMHGNPDREALEMLWNARGNAAYTVHITYPISEIDVEREKDWIKEQTKEKKRQKKNSELEVRPDWSPAKHSLAAFFAEHEDFAKKVNIVEDDKRHVINLIDELAVQTSG